jgi:hypothetical protein
MSVIVVSGALANKPFNGGNAWSRLSWIVGFARLGFEVFFVEEISTGSCVDAAGGPIDFHRSVNVAYFRAVMEQFGLKDRCALLCDGGNEVCGLPFKELVKLARADTLLFNISGHLAQPELKTAFKHLMYYDDDPGFTQFWDASGSQGARLGGHDSYFTLGANIGTAGCSIPTSGRHWRHTRPPAVIQDWPVVTKAELDRFTTVASWRGVFGAIEFQGQWYGAKAHEFRKFIEMPSRVACPFEIALQIHPGDHKDIDSLTANGWGLVDPRSVADAPDSFRRYVQQSGAEFSVAQGVYVETNSGWFSDRTVRYLASGRPALVQDTGFSRHMPVGEGLVTFRTLDEAVDGANRIAREYRRHCRAARRIAEDYFDADRVIGQLLGEVGFG